MTKKRKSNSYDPRKTRDKVKCSHENVKVLTYGIYCEDCENIKYHSKKIRTWLESLSQEDFMKVVAGI